MGDDEADQKPRELLDTASAIGGALAGTAVTLVAGPFVGSASGELVARVLLRVGAEIQHRLLAPRQERRIAQAYQSAADGIAEQLEAGRVARSDGFFDSSGPDRESPADELIEGVLLTAANEWEQRKVPYIGRIFAGLSFDPSINPSEANYLVKLADRLTYRQVVLLAFWQAAQEPNRRYEQEIIMLGVDQAQGGGSPTPTLIAEMNDLAAAGLLGVARDNGEVLRPGATMGGMEAGGSFSGTDLNTVRLTSMGATLYRLMDLRSIPDQDLDEVLSAIRGGDATPESS